MPVSHELLRGTLLSGVGLSAATLEILRMLCDIAKRNAGLVFKTLVSSATGRSHARRMHSGNA